MGIGYIPSSLFGRPFWGDIPRVLCTNEPQLGHRTWAQRLTHLPLGTHIGQVPGTPTDNSGLVPDIRDTLVALRV